MNYNIARTSLLFVALLSGTNAWGMKRPSRPDHEYVFKNKDTEHTLRKQVHQKDSSFYCVLCDASFKSKRTLQVHVHNIHNDSLGMR